MHTPNTENPQSLWQQFKNMDWPQIATRAPAHSYTRPMKSIEKCVRLIRMRLQSTADIECIKNAEWLLCNNQAKHPISIRLLGKSHIYSIWIENKLAKLNMLVNAVNNGIPKDRRRTKRKERKSLWMPSIHIGGIHSGFLWKSVAYVEYRLNIRLHFTI